MIISFEKDEGDACVEDEVGGSALWTALLHGDPEIEFEDK